MEIRNVSLIGLGALGVLFGDHLSKQMSAEHLQIIADKQRITRYRHDGIYCNGAPCAFNYVSPEESVEPADLIVIAVKYNDLDNAVAAINKHVGPNTIILSLLNGISSEELIGHTYGMDKVLLCVAQGMDAVKVGNSLTYQNKGFICFGDAVSGIASAQVTAVEHFFKRTGIPYEVVSDMKKRQWSKFMLNVGANQTNAVYLCDYAGIQHGGAYRQTMISAMEEVAVLADKEQVSLTQEDIDYWLKIIDSLNPQGKTSMQQDIEAKRHSEVELFAGTVLNLGRKHHLEFPVNQMLYDKIKALESTF